MEGSCKPSTTDKLSSSTTSNMKIPRERPISSSSSLSTTTNESSVLAQPRRGIRRQRPFIGSFHAARNVLVNGGRFVSTMGDYIMIGNLTVNMNQTEIGGEHLVSTMLHPTSMDQDELISDEVAMTGSSPTPSGAGDTSLGSDPTSPVLLAPTVWNDVYEKTTIYNQSIESHSSVADAHDTDRLDKPLSDPTAYLSDLVREAVTDAQIIVNENETGAIQSGTLNGLVERLIVNFNIPQDMEYRDVLFVACLNLTTPEELFGMVSRRFDEAELRLPDCPESRVAVQHNVFMVIMYWLSNQHFGPQLLSQMRDFCESAIRKKSSRTMVNKARDLLRQVNMREGINPSPLVSHGKSSVQAPQIKPHELAIALALLEGDKYKLLTPCDYTAHLGSHPGHNIDGAYKTTNKIIFWVKDSVLHYDTVARRANVLNFFINAAQECRKLRNFSSLVAIATALHSPPIDRLKLTKSSLSLKMQDKLQDLYDIIDPTDNHRTYRKALNGASSVKRDRCVPWLAVHLEELRLVLQSYPITVQVDGHPLINFQRYLKFMDCVNEVLVRYKPPDLEEYRQLGQLDYLENQLRKLRMSPTSDDTMMARSRALEAREALDFKTRKHQLGVLGFRT